jgi:HlyD family secretion protein
MNRTALWMTIALAAPLAGCGKKKAAAGPIETAVVTQRDIVVTAQATGTVEPIDTVAIKPQASGLITAMPVDVGSQVKPGDLIAQIDTRNLKNDYDRAVAAQAAAKATLTVTQSALDRANQLFAQKVITADEHESAVVGQANAKSQLTSAQTNLKTAQQALEYATVRADVAGTVISKVASVGSVVSSAVSTFGGGSTLITIANLQRVRMRALVNETDIGNVTPGMPVTVTIDAFPNRTFQGSVEKVEPQAVINQSVTMFPVLVSLTNLDQALLPGMNGQVNIVTQQRHQVPAVPNDAVRSVKDLTAAAAALGVNPDSMQAMMRASRGGRGGASTSANAQGANPQGGVQGGAQGAAPGGGAGGGQRTRGAGGGGAGGAAAGGAGMGGANAMQIVFVKTGTSWTPHRVRLGVSDFDYSEVLRGLNPGDTVALLGAAVLQAQRDQQADRVRSMTGNGLPGTGSTTPPRGGGGGGGRGQ